MGKKSSDQPKEESGATPETHASASKHLMEMIADMKVTMMTTIGADGTLHSRPMMTQQTGEDGVLWFFTSDHHGKADELGRDPRINLAYSMPDKSQFVTVSGLAEIVHDEQKKRELWKPIYRAWFPEGVDDAHCALIRVFPERAEYWDAPSSMFVEIVGFAKAVMTGKTYTPSDFHEKIEFTTGKTEAGLHA